MSADWISPPVRDYLQGKFSEVMEIAKAYRLPHDFQRGHRPRHFAGALDKPEQVEVLLILAEPGSTPYNWEIGRWPDTWLDDVCSDGVGQRGGHPFVYDPAHSFDNRYEARFAVWPALFLGQVYPNLSARERMERAIIANSFWMQADASGGRIPRGAERAFAPILAGFVDMFPSATVIAAGRKASDRLTLAGCRHVPMSALTLPEYNKPSAKESRDQVAGTIRSKIGQ